MATEEKHNPKEEEKLEIEDIKDPEEDIDIEEAVSESEEQEEKTPEIEPKETDKKDEPVKVEEKAEDEDMLEKSVLEAGADEKEEKIEEKKKNKKSNKWKVALIVIATILTTAAIVLGIVYYFTTKNQAKTEEAKTEETKAEETDAAVPAVTTDKSVYVNEIDGLRLRKEPNANAEILDTMPYGTKLTPLETSGEWIKVEYNGKTGWCKTSYTSTTNPLVYQNTDYGFEITFPTTWSGYKIFKKDASDPVSLYVAIPTTDKTWAVSDPVEKGYAGLFAFGIYTKDQWETAKNEEMKPTYLGEKGNYVITWSSGQATPTDQTARFEEIKSIIATFKII